MKPYVKLTWIIQDRLFYLKWPQEVDGEIIRDYTQQVIAAMDASPSDNVHYISDTRPMKTFPSVKDARQMLASFKHDRMGWTISLSGFNPALKTLVHIFSNALGIRVHMVKEIEEALQFLNETDPSLPPLSSYQSMIEELAAEVV
jgi:hypothetical protein